MNNAKKLKPKKEVKDGMKVPKVKRFSMPWIIITSVLVVFLVGGLLFDQLYAPTLMTVDGKKYHLQDLAYYFYSTESNYASYNQMFGGNSWDKDFGGTTLRNAARKDAMDQSLQYEILYNEAVAKGYSLTAKEKNDINSDVNSILKSLNEKVVEKNHFTKEYLTKIIKKTTLVSRYRKDLTNDLKIDKEKIKAGISYEDYRQYNIQYIFGSTQKTDKKGNTIDMSDAEKKTVYDKINSYYNEAQTTKDWSKLVPTDETALVYKEGNFTKKGNNFSDAFKNTMMNLNNGDVSQVYSDEKGYYIVRMVNNKATTNYDSAVNTAVTKAETKAFNKVYDKIKAKHKYHINEKQVNKLKFGNLTLVG